MIFVRGCIEKRSMKPITKKSCMITYRVVLSDSVTLVKQFAKLSLLDEQALPVNPNEVLDIPVKVKVFGSNVEYTYVPNVDVDEEVVEF
jgi:hypothetical protein